MRIGVDLDGVLYDFVDSLRGWLCQATGRDDLGPATCWDFFEHDWGFEWPYVKEEWVKGIDAGVIWRVGVPEVGASEVLTGLRDAGHTVHIVTSRNWGARAVQNTMEWLAEHEIPYDTITFSVDKTLLDVDVFIEDNVENYQALRAAGIDAVLINRAWNTQLEDAVRVDTLVEFARYVEDRRIDVVGLSGYAQTGKDTSAELLAAQGRERLAFADTLREVLYALNPIVKRRWFRRPLRVRDVVDSLGWDEAKFAHRGEIRNLLQRLGTEGGRNVLGENIWVDATFRKMQPGGKYAISDVRFVNEADAVKAKGGKNLRLVRPGYGPVNDHVSEIALDDYPFDALVMNTDGLDHLRDELLVATNGR